jgi:F-type H+-transporting ATPase subunit b
MQEKKIMSRKIVLQVIGIASALLMFMAFPCVAAETSEGSGFDRHTWDLVWRLINFAILAFVIIKYGKPPLMKFLVGKGEEQAVRFGDLEKQASDLAKEEEEQKTTLTHIDDRIQKIKDYYHQVGQEEKERIIAETELLKQQIQENARQKIVAEFEDAKKAFRKDVVEQAVGLAETRIRGNLDLQDQEGLVQKYLDQLTGLPHSAK